MYKHTHKLWVLSFDVYCIYTALMIFSTPNPKPNPHLYHKDKLCTFIIPDGGDLWFIFLTFTLLLNCSWSVWRHTLHDWDSIPSQHWALVFLFLLFLSKCDMQKGKSCCFCVHLSVKGEIRWRHWSSKFSRNALLWLENMWPNYLPFFSVLLIHFFKYVVFSLKLP